MPLILPIMHPADIIQGQAQEEPAQVVALKRAADWLLGKRINLPPTGPPPNSRLRPNIYDLLEYSNNLGDYDSVSIDIENAGDFITLIGVTAFCSRTGKIGKSISLPFRTEGGKDYWEKWDNHLKAVRWLYMLLADESLAKVFHNGVSHDVLILEKHGFKVRGEIWDTLVMQHYCYPEIKKSLQYGATVFVGAPVWKDMLDEEEKE